MRRSVIIYPDRQGKNPYLAILSRGLESAGFELVSWKEQRGPSEEPEALLLHWFENRAVDKGPRRRFIVNARRASDYRRRLERIEAMRRSGTKIVWFVHNRRPHNLSTTQGSYHRRIAPFWPLIDGVVHLTHASREDEAFHHLGHLPSSVVPHPHYDRIDPSAHARAAGRVSRLAFIGGLSARKRAMSVIEMVLCETALDVVVTGASRGGRDESRLRALGPDRLEVLHHPVDDEGLYRVFDGRTAAVITDAEALNSGVLMLALSRGAPVLSPPTPTNLELAEEFGSDWIRLLPATLDGAAIERLARQDIPSRLPGMARRTPEAVSRTLVTFISELEAGQADQGSSPGEHRNPR